MTAQQISYDTYRKHIEQMSYLKKQFQDKNKVRIEKQREVRQLTREVNKLRDDLLNLIPEWK